MPLHLPESIRIDGCRGPEGHPLSRHTVTSLDDPKAIGSGESKCSLISSPPSLDFIVTYTGKIARRGSLKKAVVSVSCPNKHCRFHQEYKPNP